MGEINEIKTILKRKGHTFSTFNINLLHLYLFKMQIYVIKHS
jgi:hypothetical protein